MMIHVKVLLGALHEADAEVHGGDQGDCDGRGGQVPGPQPQQVQVRNRSKLTLLVYTVSEIFFQCLAILSEDTQKHRRQTKDISYGFLHFLVFCSC
jgi:hypothetical protein